MRLGSWDLIKIKKKILEDMYGAAEADFEERKTEIAKQNREYYLAPLMPILDQLPEDMITRDYLYKLIIKYSPDPKNTFITKIEQTWVYKSDTLQINPHSPTQQYEQAESKLDSRLYGITKTLCNEMLELLEEKKKLTEYLNETINKYSGTLQLRKVWPEYLHKYLPAEPPKVSRKKKVPKSIKADPAIPDFIPTRLTTNLLEGK